MTTRLTKAVAREITVVGYSTPLIVAVSLAGVTYRIKGTRTTYLLPHGVAFQRAAQLEADARRRQREPRKGRISRRDWPMTTSNAPIVDNP